MNGNLNYIIRRLIYLVPVLLGVCFLVFILFNLTAGDPALMLVGKNGSAEQYEAIREQLGLNKPYYAQYFDIVKSAFTFDFGRSWNTKQDIAAMMLERAIPSLSLSLPAFTLGTLTSLIFALGVAYFRGRGIDLFVRISCIAMMSISSLVYILFFQYFFAYELGLFEISGYEFAFPDIFFYITLPVMIWVITSLGPDIRFYRTLILDEIYQDYVRTARAKGLSERVILFKHVLRNAMIPVVTYLVVQLPFLILGALLLESFFSIPGLGGMTIEALNSSDFPVLKAVTIFSAVAYIIFTLIQDILYTLVDPRVKLQ